MSADSPPIPANKQASTPNDPDDQSPALRPDPVAEAEGGTLAGGHRASPDRQAAQPQEPKPEPAPARRPANQEFEVAVQRVRLDEIDGVEEELQDFIEVAKVVAMPFLGPADLPVVKEEGVDALVEGVRRVYADVIAHAERVRAPGQALLAMGHLYMTGTAISELSERKILGGNQHALPADLFPESLVYVALGHLHLAQAVTRESIRYSGSPIPLSMAEIDYSHQVCVVDIDAGKLVSVASVAIPRKVDLLRVPTEASPLAEVEAALVAMASRTHLPPDE